MTPEERKARVRHFVEELYNKKNLAVIDEDLPPNWVQHHPTYPQVKDRESFKKWAAAIHESYPDCHMTIEDIIVAEDKVIVRFTWRGTSKGTVIATSGAPTGKTGEMAGIWIERFEGDQTVETWAVQDTLGLMQQLGYVLVQKDA